MDTVRDHLKRFPQHEVSRGEYSFLKMWWDNAFFVLVDIPIVDDLQMLIMQRIEQEQ
jgi:hypothetical protein